MEYPGSVLKIINPVNRLSQFSDLIKKIVYFEINSQNIYY